MISDKNVVTDLTSLLRSYGVKHVIISPGSRNAPFIISFTNKEDFTCYSIVDERSAGYFALGIAQQSKSPVALVCTSGTASLNYFSAIAEAYFQHIPLVVITADRPTERIGQGEGQSVFQKNVYGNHVKSSVELAENYTTNDTARDNHRKICETMNRCLSSNQGPVHFNVPLSEDLYGTLKFPTSFPKPIFYSKIKKSLASDELNFIKGKLNESKKTLLLIGSLSIDIKLTEQISQWSQKQGALVLTENTSNLVDTNFVQCIDRLIMSFGDDENTEFLPDLLITCGNNIISKKIKFLLRSKKIQEHWHINDGNEVMDTFQSLTKVIGLTPLEFFNLPFEVPTIKSSYSSLWKNRELEIQKKQKEFDQSVSFSDYSVVAKLLQLLPSQSILQMGNSSLVRYVQLFNPRKDITYFSNRGTSGIDGCVSTAVGYATTSNKEVYLLVGDISFFYDSNALWNKHLSNNLKIILVNNGGGGIFNIIDGPSKTNSLEYFTTTHQLTAKHICAMHQVEYQSIVNMTDFESGIEELKKANTCSLLEVNTRGIDSDKILKDFFKFITNK